MSLKFCVVCSWGGEPQPVQWNEVRWGEIFTSAPCWLSAGRERTGGPRNTPLRHGDRSSQTRESSIENFQCLPQTEKYLAEFYFEIFPLSPSPLTHTPPADHITNRSSDQQQASFVRSFVIGIVLYCYRCKRGKLPTNYQLTWLSDSERIVKNLRLTMIKFYIPHILTVQLSRNEKRDYSPLLWNRAGDRREFN